MNGFKPNKGRSIDLKKSVHVYRNLTRKCLSIVQDGLVVGHAQSVTLKNVSYHISPSKYKEFLKSGHKNVHAKAKGIIIHDFCSNDKQRIFYNPMVAPYFRRGKYAHIRVDKTQTLEINANGFMQATL